REESSELWNETARFIEAGDWLVSQLVGREVRSTCQAGYKAHYLSDLGYAAEIEELVPGLGDRLAAPTPIGKAAGEVTSEWLDRTGLEGAPVVAVATVDAHAVVPAVGVSEAGTVVATLGTSACHLIMSPECHRVPGVGGVVENGILPGLWGYEAGQAGFGDLLAWFVRTFPHGADEAESFAYYNAEAARLAPGASGVMALDWWNGCRTPLIDPELAGLFVGMTLQTTAPELYRALLESLAFGMRRVVDTLEGGGLEIGELVVTSGLAEKNPLLVQIIADVSGRTVRLPEVQEATARGAAIHGAVAAGAVADFADGAARLGAQSSSSVPPDSSVGPRYSELYQLYRRLSDSVVESGVMPALRRLRADS
ncbi:MAG TPA: FGGY-family carbohydrate kinase, partial [Gammaproteobacteria bacterium]|nr:FGGY-family carbohydrate kinase [Gammaproteobacteria bacterium]